MKKSFWSDKPLIVTADASCEDQILSNAALLEKLEQETAAMPFQLDYAVVDVTTERLRALLAFLNDNYVLSDGCFRLVYTEALLAYFCQDALVIEFYPKGKQTLVGCIVGRHDELYLYGTVRMSMEVDFWCLTTKLRNMGVSTFMANILTIVSLRERGVGNGHATMATAIKCPSIGQKKFYHRILNARRLVEADMLGSEYLRGPRKKLCETFGYSRLFGEEHQVYNLTADSNKEEVIAFIHTSYLAYCHKTYDVFVNISYERFRASFDNTAFYHIVIRSKTTAEVVAFICFYRLDSINSSTGATVKSGYPYFVFFHTSLEECLELVHEFIYHNDIFDQVIYPDMFDLDYRKIRCKDGTGLLHYYLFNTSSKPVLNHRNGLITI